MCFRGLFNFLKQYYHTDYHNLIGLEQAHFNEEYGYIFNRFIFLFLFCKIIDYIDELKDEDSPLSNQANSLFSLLEEQEKLELKDSIRLCSQLSFDIFNDLLEAFTDNSWIYQTGLISDKLSRQKEREKQEIIDSLESKTSDERQVMVHHQNCGLSNYFHTADKQHLEHLESESYGQTLGDERLNMARELFAQNETELEVLEGMGIEPLNIHSHHSLENEIQEAYPQNDQDREDEGADDADEDGDYKDN